MHIRLALLVCLFAGSAFAGERFERVFCWGSVTDEASARAYAEVGVTDVFVKGTNGLAAARKYGLRTYCGFGPNGTHGQVLSAEEKKHFDYLNATELKKSLTKDERRAEIEARRKKANCQFGGEPQTLPDMCPDRIICFLGDEALSKSKARMDKTLGDNPQVDGIAFDYIGYVNLHSCECEDCKTRFAVWLKAGGRAENEENRNLFFREQLVNYINALVDYAKSVRPGIKVAMHLYPAFRPDPLYGKDLKADYIEETVAWYFQWPDEKISDYTRRIVTTPHMPGARSVPFVGLNATEGRALAYKSPERLDHELRLILAAGGRSVAVCNGADMLKPGYREVFMRYAPARRSPIDWEKAEDVAPGVKATGYRTESPRLMECRFLRVDLRQKGLSFVSTDRAKEWGEAMPDVTNRTMIIDTRRETSESFMKRKRGEGVNVVATINTAPWSPWEKPFNHKYARLPNLTIADGKVVSHAQKPGPMLLIWNDNTAVITNGLAEADFGRVAAAHPGFGVIMRGGAVPERRPGTKPPALAPRTAFGISADGRYLYALIVDGRQPDWSMGADMVDLAGMLKDAGASDAMNMDGGGSTTLVTLGPDGKTLVHRNRHDPKYGYYRPVALNLGVVVSPEGK